MKRMGRAGRALGAVLMVSLTLMGCATSRGAGLPSGAVTDPAGSGEVARRCGDLVKSLRYAEKSVAGRAAATAILAPLAIGIGLAGVATGDPRGLVLAAGGPVQLVGWTARAGKENGERFDRLRQTCEDGGGPDTAATARAVRNLAEVRLGERSTRDAIRLYRDTLVILDRAEAGESEDAATTALALARLVESKRPADPEVGPLYDRALRIRQVDADARPRELATVLALYAGWLRTSGRIADAEAMEARAAALSHEIQAAEERARASLVPPHLGYRYRRRRALRSGRGQCARPAERGGRRAGRYGPYPRRRLPRGWLGQHRSAQHAHRRQLRLDAQRPGYGSRGGGPPGPHHDRAMTPVPPHGEL